MKVGFGYDIHRLVPGRKLILGGVEIPSSVGEEGFSDGDVLLHAVIDALLGPSDLGDIGSNFPPGNPEFAGISSVILLRKTGRMIDGKGYSVINADCTVVLEEPKILPYVRGIRSSIASCLGMDADRVSVRGKTKEGLDAAGSHAAVEAYAVVLLKEPGE
jgi:2-C-methyl-D-erythritol 2,4-cyclodiphosphate synthase